MSSKFKGILERVKERDDEPDAGKAASPLPSPSKVGRPPGKRSDSDYIQISAYIRKSVHQDVKIALIKTGSSQDFSELIDELLEKWIRTHT